MRDAPLDALADAAGIATHWRDAFGVTHEVGEDTLRAVLAAIGLTAASETQCRNALSFVRAERNLVPPLVTGDEGVPVELPGVPGRYRIIAADGSVVEGIAEAAGDGRVMLAPVQRPGDYRLELGERLVDLAIAPARAFTVGDAGTTRPWGLSVQVYSARRAGARIGDFVALADLARSAARHGADVLAISPVHAPFAAAPERFSPYAPSSRIALNPLYVDASGGPAPEHLIDWPQAHRAGYQALRAAFASGTDSAGFAAFERYAPERVRRHASLDFRVWPAALRDPADAAVAEAAMRLAGSVRFHLYAQYRAQAGLAAAQQAACAAGMAIGLVTDLAVGTDPSGSDSWGQRDAMLHGLSIGAPPDALSREGQGWGLTSFAPNGLIRDGFAGFRAMLRAQMAPAGGMRIDHAMGFTRLWVIPEGAAPTAGCYLAMPFADMMRVTVLESWQNRAIVLAEDLGTVPEGFRATLASRGLLGMSVLWFERRGEGFMPPALWRRESAGMTSTHDVPTVAGWWRGTDIGWREHIGLAGDDWATRVDQRAHLWWVVQDSGSASGAMPPPEDAETIADALAAHLGSTQAEMALLPMEDALALDQQPNLPGTTDEHPNWRRVLPGEAATMLGDEAVAARLARLHHRRSALALRRNE
ncbi:MAG: hypothetical protein B7Z57_03140 [Acidiphilium sp. 37-60-79]|nr:MAG: hypothetical protein B7Z57_03140 [Acidiphilium sp. 37-60-79]